MSLVYLLDPHSRKAAIEGRTISTHLAAMLDLATRTWGPGPSLREVAGESDGGGVGFRHERGFSWEKCEFNPLRRPPLAWLNPFRSYKKRRFFFGLVSLDYQYSTKTFFSLTCQRSRLVPSRWCMGLKFIMVADRGTTLNTTSSQGPPPLSRWSRDSPVDNVTLNRIWTPKNIDVLF